MNTENVDEATEAATEVGTQEQESKMFSQDQLDKIVEDRLAKAKRSYEKRFSGVDPDHYRELVEADEAKKLEAQKARGEFEDILKNTVAKKDEAINQLRNELHAVKVDGALMSAASKSGAINTDQVVQLLKSNIRLGEDGNAEIIDHSGQPRYTEQGEAYSVDLLVSEFLDSNPHFKPSTPGGSSTASNVAPNKTPKFDLASLDMHNPEHRKLYAEARAKGLV